MLSSYPKRQDFCTHRSPLSRLGWQKTFCSWVSVSWQAGCKEKNAFVGAGKISLPVCWCMRSSPWQQAWLQPSECLRLVCGCSWVCARVAGTACLGGERRRLCLVLGITDAEDRDFVSSGQAVPEERWEGGASPSIKCNLPSASMLQVSTCFWISSASPCCQR